MSDKIKTIEANKEHYQKEASLLKDMESNKEPNKEGKQYWREGRADTNELGDFMLNKVEAGSHSNAANPTALKEEDRKKLNKKTAEMYDRYFAAQKSKNGLESDPTVKQWVHDGASKAAKIKDQARSTPQTQATVFGFDSMGRFAGGR